jgi:hypothetical protein
MLQALGGRAGGAELGSLSVRRASASGGTTAKNGVVFLKSGGLYCNDWRKVVRRLAGNDRSFRLARRTRMTASSLLPTSGYVLGSLCM